MACVAMFCRSRTTKQGVKDPKLSFHVFPKCPEIRAAWIKAVRRKNWEPTKYSRLCSKHFEPSCFLNGLSVIKLKSDAVPTIFEGYPKYYQPVTKKLRGSRKDTSPQVLSSSLELSITPKRKIEIPVVDNRVAPCIRSLLLTIDKIQNKSVRRIRLIKTLRESKRKALKKIASLKNIINKLKSQQILEPKTFNEIHLRLEGGCYYD